MLGLLKQANDSIMGESALVSYLEKLQTEFIIRIDLATDEDVQRGQTGKGLDQGHEHLALENSSEQELEEWKKKMVTLQSGE